MWATAAVWGAKLLGSKALWYTLGIAGIVGTIFVGGCNYGASGKKQVEEEFEQYKVAQALIVKNLQDEGKKNAIKTNEKLKAEERNREDTYKKHSTELAKLDRQLDSVKLDLALVQLLNDSAVGARKDQPTTGPEKRTDGAANETTSAPSPVANSPNTLMDLAETVLINNKNHHACADQVEAWQGFYNKLYESFD
jgi:hypothetical protein